MIDGNQLREEFGRYLAEHKATRWGMDAALMHVCKIAYDAGRADERERICAAIKAEDDYCVTEGDYMLDSDDCIRVARGTWERPDYALRGEVKP